MNEATTQNLETHRVRKDPRPSDPILYFILTVGIIYEERSLDRIFRCFEPLDAVRQCSPVTRNRPGSLSYRP